MLKQVNEFNFVKPEDIVSIGIHQGVSNYFFDKNDFSEQIQTLKNKYDYTHNSNLTRVWAITAKEQQIDNLKFYENKKKKKLTEEKKLLEEELCDLKIVKDFYKKTINTLEVMELKHEYFCTSSGNKTDILGEVGKLYFNYRVSYKKNKIYFNINYFFGTIVPFTHVDRYKKYNLEYDINLYEQENWVAKVKDKEGNIYTQEGFEDYSRAYAFVVENFDIEMLEY